MTGPLRGELRPWQLLGEHPDPAPPNTETLRGARRLNRGADPMTEQRHTVDSITSDALDALYDERDRYFHFACAARGASGARDFPDLTDTILALRDRAEQAEAAIERVKNLRTIAPDGAQGPTWAALDLAIRDALGQPQQPTTTEADSARCVCGDPIKLRNAIDPNSWVHGPASDTPCWNARPAQQPTTTA